MYANQGAELERLAEAAAVVWLLLQVPLWYELLSLQGMLC